MGTTVTVAGANYTVPTYQDQGWGQGAGSVNQLLIALAANIASSPTLVQTVSVTSSPQSVLSGRTYLVTTASVAITLNLPVAAANTWFMVKDVSNNAFTNNITIHRAAAETIDGVASDFVIANNSAGWLFVCDGTNWWTLGSAYDLRLSDTSDGNKYKVMTIGGVLSTQQV